MNTSPESSGPPGRASGEHAAGTGLPSPALWKRLTVVTLASVGISLAVSPIAARVFGLALEAPQFAMAVIIPLIVAPLVAYRNQKLSVSLEEERARVRELTGLLPICAWCRKIRDDAGSWKTLERFVAEQTSAEITHSICPDCSARHYPDEK